MYAATVLAPNRTQARIAKRLIAILDSALASRGFSAESGVCCMMPNCGFRHPRVALFGPDAPDDELPKCPPDVVAEVISDHDLHTDVMEKLHDHEHWRVPHI